MKDFLLYGLVLFVIVFIACGVLVWINSKTEPLIAQNMQLAEDNARRYVFPGAERFELVETENFSYYRAFDIADSLLGYTFIAQEQGYSGVIQKMVGINTDMIINQIFILSHTETPGLGGNCTKPEFLARFANLTKDDMKVNKDGGVVESITGSTITTRAIVNSVKKYIEMLERELPTESEEI